MKYAIIESELVTNVIMADKDFVDANYPTAVDITDESPQPGRGWAYSEGEFTPPEKTDQPTVPSRIPVEVHISMTGGDDQSPPGIKNDGVESIAIAISLKLPDGSAAPLADGNYRIVIRDSADAEYDVISVPFTAGSAAFNYTSDLRPATAHINVDDLSIPGVDVEFTIVGDNLIKIYRVLS